MLLLLLGEAAGRLETDGAIFLKHIHNQAERSRVCLDDLCLSITIRVILLLVLSSNCCQDFMGKEVFNLCGIFQVNKNV